METLADVKKQWMDHFDQLLYLIPKLLIAIVVIILLSVFLRWSRKRLMSLLNKKTEDKLLSGFINSFIRITNVVILILLFLYTIGLGDIAGSIMGAAGISAFIIGFALKDIGENFLAGVIMAFDRPFRLGDTIKTGEVEGTVTEMSLRDTHVKTFDGKDVYVPNGQIIKKPLYNYTIDGFIRLNFIVGVDYGSNIDLARNIILETIKKIPGILIEEKAPRTHVKHLNSSSIDIECFFWMNTFDTNYSGLELKSQAQSECVKALKENSINIPYQIIEIKQ